jgi:hypothetical protein
VRRDRSQLETSYGQFGSNEEGGMMVPPFHVTAIVVADQDAALGCAVNTVG